MNEQELLEVLNKVSLMKRNGVLDSENHFENQSTKWRNTLDYDILKACAKHHNAEIRLNMLALLTDSRKSTLKFSGPELDLIILFLTYNLGEKLEYLPLMKKVLKRTKDSLAVLRRQLLQEKKARERHQTLNEANICEEAISMSHRISITMEADIETYSKFCIELHNTYESNKEMAFQILKPLDKTTLRLDIKSQLYQMIQVAFELGNSIRPIDSVTAAYMLKFSMLSPLIQEVLHTHFEYQDNYSDVPDAVVLQFVLLLMKKLEASLTLAKKNIVLTVTKHSLYGYLFCLRSLLNECDLKTAGKEILWRDTISKLILMCFELNQAVSLIVNNSSPEGHLPMDLNPKNMNNMFSLNDKEIVTPQMVLLCSWRTVKEISLLFGELITKSPIYGDSATVEHLNEDQIVQIGEHFVTLLYETKHRGAFEQAYVGFSQLCTYLWRLKNINLSKLPKLWLHQILLAITGLTQENTKLCATRRSAGIPLMVQALLSTDPSRKHSLESSTFHSVMKILLGFTEFAHDVDLRAQARCLIYEKTVFSEFKDHFDHLKFDLNEDHVEQNKSQITEIKTHALNILRAIFKHSQLGESVKNYIGDGLIAAFKSYDGKTWAERNAATLLFSALIIRIFGVQRTKDHVNLTAHNKMTGKIFFEKYPVLLPFLLAELRTFVSMTDTLAKANVHSILLLLSRLYLNHNIDGTDINWKINEFINLVSQCANCPIYKTRELTARALVPLLIEKSANEIVNTLLHSLASAEKDHLSLNLVHGYMLQVLAIVRTFNSVHEILHTDLYDTLNAAKWILENLEVNNHKPICFPAATAYINIIHSLFKKNHGLLDNSNLVELWSVIVRHFINYHILKPGPGQEIYKISILKLMLDIKKSLDTSSTKYCCSAVLSVPIMSYSRFLNTSQSKLQITAWYAVIEIINETPSNEEKMLLAASAIDIAHQSINDLILKKIRLSSHSNRYDERPTYLRLLGKSYVTLHYHSKGHKEAAEYQDEIYRSFCDSSWICILHTDFRTSILNIMYDLICICREDSDEIKSAPALSWWTTMLQLLVDDNYEVRVDASKLISKIKPCTDVECTTRILQIFFEKFYEIMAKNSPGPATIALFCWSISLLDDFDYEMDETDVFNKCRNRDWFEPVQISQQCVHYLKLIMQSYSIDDELPIDAIRWINYYLNLSFQESISFRQLVSEYKNYVPVLDENIKAILDPMYKDKLLQILAYKKYPIYIMDTDSSSTELIKKEQQRGKTTKDGERQREKHVRKRGHRMVIAIGAASGGDKEKPWLGEFPQAASS
ncbi:hypothetical protein KM043_018130 [Ampulex compressa]|nr:hypothetical protein KM043_018130 [Ampulex compressa]